MAGHRLPLIVYGHRELTFSLFNDALHEGRGKSERIHFLPRNDNGQEYQILMTFAVACGVEVQI
jgi:hypothetical protein